jgi:hypothetical protein
MYDVKEPFWQFVDHWQTLIAALIAGLLALGAAAWTIWATIRSANRQITAARGQTEAARRQVTALKDQIEDARTARRQSDERRLSVIKWAVGVEAGRVEAAVSALRGNALPSRPQPANRTREQLIIESSPLLRGEREEISLLDDQTRGLLEKLAGIIDEYNSRIQTAVFAVQGPLIEQTTLDLIDRLAEVVRDIQSVL